MNPAGKHPEASVGLSKTANSRPTSTWISLRTTVSGFSLVEVLVTALLIGISLLGIAALQGRTIGYTTEAMQRSTASMLAADLLELIRAAPDAWTRYLQSGPSTTAGAALCTNTPSPPGEQLACWLAEVKTMLPSAAELPAQSTYVCLSPATGTCNRNGTAIEIQVAWKGSYCLNADTQCHVRLRSEI